MIMPAGEAEARFGDALLASVLFAVDPHGLGGIRLRARPGPVRDLFFELLMTSLQHLPVKKMPMDIDGERLAGGLDLAATLGAGRPVYAKGMLAACDGGVLVVPMAERLPVQAACLLRQVLDEGRVSGTSSDDAARVGVVLMDEGDGPDEHAPAGLMERVAFQIDIEGIALGAASGLGTDLPDAREARAFAGVAPPSAESIVAICGAAAALGITSVRAVLFTLRAAAAHARINGRDEIEPGDLAVAGRLVLAPQAVQMPPLPGPEDQTDEETEGEQGEQGRSQSSPQALKDVVLDAVRPRLPPRLLDIGSDKRPGRRGKTGARGTSGAMRFNALHGRPAGVRRGDPRSGSRISLYETLRAAAPWQRLRRAGITAGERPTLLVVTMDDIRIKRYAARAVTTVVFAVDASGSAASQRLAEAKGAVELILAECYVRRDKVALVSFRGKSAELLLPPTRSLTRARRSLADLPGGGGTPLASGLDAAYGLAHHLKRQGEAPLLVVMTDGRANVSRDGAGGRKKAAEDADRSAMRCREAGLDCLMLDISLRGSPEALQLAGRMGARYLLIPGAEAGRVASAVSVARSQLSAGG